jgi:single-stranded-DNA-specific exonuclease
VEGVNITEAIASQRELLLGFGGHPMAAGLSMDSESIPVFRRGIGRYTAKTYGAVPAKASLAIDAVLRLGDLTLDLVTDLERLAPFGAGNPPLTLAIPRLEILNATTIGRDGSHLQIQVKDEADQVRRVLWWGGADWPMPEGLFDLACTVRASNFRGQRDVQVEWIDARPVAPESITLRRARVILDQRALDHPIPVLRNLLEELARDGVIVWAEGEARERLSALDIPCADRSALAPASAMILWSAPPGRAELDAALETVKPQTVILFGLEPAPTAPEAFLKRIAGLAKYTIDQLGGEAPLTRLAAAAGQREATTRLGIRWLEERGLLRASEPQPGVLRLQTGLGVATGVETTLFRQISRLLEETAAYQRYFQTADKDNLL